MKNGLLNENGSLVYYRDDRPTHAGVVKIGDKIYYIGKNGRAVIGEKKIRREMCNGILREGTYTFDKDGTLIEGSCVERKSSGHKKKAGKKKSSAKNKTDAGTKKWKIVVRAAGMILTLLAVMIVVVLVDKQDGFVSELMRKQHSSDEQTFEAEFPLVDGEVLLCSEAAKDEYDGEMAIAEAVKSGSPYRALTIRYFIKGERGIFRISESENFTDYEEYLLNSSRNTMTIDNLKTGTEYYYKAIQQNGEVHSGSFRTAESTRFVTLPGLSNTRDIGGYTNSEGKRIRQGMIIRGTELDGLNEPKLYLDDKAVDSVCDTFGFVLEMDLRGKSGSGESAQSRFPQAGYKCFTTPNGEQIFTPYYKESLRSIFSHLADGENYPMYLHCSYGADRTGTIVYLLYGVLNMTEDDMLAEYRRTGYYLGKYAGKDMEEVNTGMEPYGGDTLSEKIVSFLTEEIGVTEEEIQSIRDLLLE